jgi:hypothetical protein
VCQKSIAGSCGAPVLEVEQSAEPLAAFDWPVPIDGSHRLLGGHQQPVAYALMVALEVVVLDVLRDRAPQVALAELLTADKFRRVLTVESTTKRLSMVQRLGRSRSAALAA